MMQLIQLFNRESQTTWLEQRNSLCQAVSPTGIPGGLLTIFAFFTLIFLYFYFIAGPLLMDIDFVIDILHLLGCDKMEITEILINSSLHDSVVNEEKGENGWE